MKSKKRTIKTAMLVLISMIVCLFGVVDAFAEDVPKADEKGSITITLMDSTKKLTAKDGSLALYQVGQMYENDGNYSWVLTEDFAESKADLSNLQDEKLVHTLFSYLAANADKIKPVGTADISKDGTVKFADLNVGLYMVVQTKASTGYKAIMPFLVTVPMKNDSDGTWNYNVDASPKVEIQKATPTPKKSPTPTPGRKITITRKPSVTRRAYVTTTVRKTTLPRTGQLWWPVGIFAVIGVVLVVVGLRKKYER